MSKSKHAKWAKKEAESIVDILVDNHLFKPHVTRAHLRNLEAYIAFVLMSRVQSQLQAERLLESIANRHKTQRK